MTLTIPDLKIEDSPAAFNQQDNVMTLIKKELMDILVCPVDKAELKELTATSQLQCTKCGRKYPVKEGIPVMLVEEAEKPENTEDK